VCARVYSVQIHMLVLRVTGHKRSQCACITSVTAQSAVRVQYAMCTMQYTMCCTATIAHVSSVFIVHVTHCHAQAQWLLCTVITLAV
jgi:hypothetical protein